VAVLSPAVVRLEQDERRSDRLPSAGEHHMEGGGYGSTDHRVRADVGGDGCVGPLLLVDAPHLHPVRRFAHGAAGLGANTAGHLARGPPRCRRD